MVIAWLVCPISSENLYTLEGRVCTTRSAVDRKNEVFFQFPTANGQAQMSAEGLLRAARSSCLNDGAGGYLISRRRDRRTKSPT